MSGTTTRFLYWCSEKLEALGKKVWVLIWDNASWHISREVRAWIDAHNKAVKKSGRGVRIISCLLPTRSPWLNAIEPKWVHGKGGWWKLTASSLLMSWPSGFAPPLGVRITSIYPLPKMSLDRALGGKECRWAS